MKCLAWYSLGMTCWQFHSWGVMFASSHEHHIQSLVGRRLPFPPWVSLCPLCFSTDRKATAAASAATTQNQLASATDPGQKSDFQHVPFKEKISWSCITRWKWPPSWKCFLAPFSICCLCGACSSGSSGTRYTLTGSIHLSRLPAASSLYLGAIIIEFYSTPLCFSVGRWAWSHS